MKKIRLIYITFLSFLVSFNSFSLEFNTGELIIVDGKNSELSSDEGYLLLSLTSNQEIDNLIIKSDRIGGNLKIKNIIKGENIALIKLKEGQYNWDSFHFYFKAGSVRFNYKKNDHSFKVEAGKINYSGSWKSQIEFPEYYKASLSLTSINQSAYEMKKIRGPFTSIFEKYPFEFHGQFNDNYPIFFKQISKIINNDNQSKSQVINYEVKQGIQDEINSYKDIEKYIKDDNQSIGNFSPNGKYLFLQIMIENYSVIRLLNLETFNMVNIFQQELPKNSNVTNIKWVDNDSIYYNVLYDGVNNKRVVHLKFDQNNALVGAEHIKLDIDGALIDSLPNQTNKMYFAQTSMFSKKKNGLYLIDVNNEKTVRKSSKKPIEIIRNLNNAVDYLTGSDGKIRFIVTREYDENEEKFTFGYWFLHPDISEWKKIFSAKTDTYSLPHNPVFISNDYKFIYVLTNEYSDKAGIHQYSTTDFNYDGIFYENNQIEITSLHVSDNSHEILGMYHVENGFHKIHYISNENDSLKQLRSKYPNHNFYIAQNNEEINKILVYGTNEYSKGSWSIYDTKSHQIEKLFETNPDYNKLQKGQFNIVKIKTEDNLTLEGYLVLPESLQKTQFPLVVIPHGGPIGVRDYAYNNDIQHFYASQGIASLKVNYRGSSGYGKKFQESGKMEWGEKIESDINLMVSHVVNNFDISEDKICSMGSSYGGYSAIMLTILYPDRYQCAVSLAGVMDLPLMFTSSDFRLNEKAIEEVKEIVGDPEKVGPDLINKSPLYLVDKISKPILLFHGDEDKRVTIEHSLRMKELLDMQNKDVQLITLKGEGHSFKNSESEIVYVARSLDFIKENLLKDTNQN